MARFRAAVLAGSTGRRSACCTRCTRPRTGHQGRHTSIGSRTRIVAVVAAAGEELLGPRGPCGCGDVRRPEAQRRHHDRDRRGLRVLFGRQLSCLSFIVEQGATMGIPGSGNSRELSGIPGSDFSLPGSETWENRQNPPVTVDAADAFCTMGRIWPSRCPRRTSYGPKVP